MLWYHWNEIWNRLKRRGNGCDSHKWFRFFFTRLHQIETSCFFKKYASDLTFYFFFSLIVLLTHISLSTMFRNQESKKTIRVIFLCPLFDCACVCKCVLGVCQYVVFFDASNIHICTIHIYTILLKTFFIFKFLDFCQQHIISLHFCIDFRSAHNLNTFYFAIDFRHEICNSVWSWSGMVDGLRLNRFRKNSICWEERNKLNHSMNYTNQMTETVTTNTMFNAIWIIRKSAFKIDISIFLFLFINIYIKFHSNSFKFVSDSEMNCLKLNQPQCYIHTGHSIVSHKLFLYFYVRFCFPYFGVCDVCVRESADLLVVSCWRRWMYRGHDRIFFANEIASKFHKFNYLLILFWFRFVFKHVIHIH